MMAFDYDNNTETWKHNPNAVITDYTSNNNYTSSSNNGGGGASPSFKYDTTNDNCNATPEAAVANIANTNNYDTAENTNFTSDDFGNAYFQNNLGADTTNTTLNQLNPLEEESQIVPVSLDHLSRDELCRMIYRLDYERNTLRDQLEALRRDQQQQLLNMNNANSAKKGKKRMLDKSSSSRPARRKNQHNRQQQHPMEDAMTMLQPTNTANTTTTSPPTSLEITNLQKRLGQKITTVIKQSAIHGLRRIPKSITTEGEITLSLVSTMMQSHESEKTNDTKRMTKWNLTNDLDITKFLQVERLVHPVKHDGIGHIFLSSSTHSKARDNVYHWAKFVNLEVRYDKREMILTLIAKTMDAGSGRPENVPERVRYSRGEM